MGHIAPVNSVDFAAGNSDYLVTSGRDRAVKIWHWRSKAVKLNIDLRKNGRGIGKIATVCTIFPENCGRNSFFESYLHFEHFETLEDHWLDWIGILPSVNVIMCQDSEIRAIKSFSILFKAWRLLNKKLYNNFLSKISSNLELIIVLKILVSMLPTVLGHCKLLIGWNQHHFCSFVFMFQMRP